MSEYPKNYLKLKELFPESEVLVAHAEQQAQFQKLELHLQLLVL